MLKKPLTRAIAFITNHREAVALTLVLLLAAFFRFWQLNHLPAGLHPDEAANGLDIIQRIKHGDIRAIYDTNGPRESLFFFLQAIFVLTLGNTVLALRLAPAIIGTLGVLFTYLLCKEWFSRRSAILASLLMASGSWAVTLSRDGFRASMIPLMIPLTLWLFTKALRQRKWWWYVLTGLSFGAGFYTYLAWRFTPFIILAILTYVFITARHLLKGLLKPLAIIALTTAIVLIPMGVYGIHHPGEVLVGRSSVSFTNPDLNHGRPLQTFASGVVKTALMFNFHGDENYRHNLGGLPMLNGFVGIMFILGLILSLRHIKDLRYFALLAVFGGMLLPEMLTAEGIPHALRAIGAIPVVYIFGAIGISELLIRWRGVFPRNVAAMSAAMAFIFLMLVLSTYYDYQRYFVAWANDPKMFDAYSEDSMAMANYLNSHPNGGNRYAIIDGYSDKVLQYLTAGKTSYQRAEAGQATSFSPTLPAELVVAESQRSGFNSELLQLHAQLQSIGYSQKRPYVVLYRVYSAGQ